ncbi:MAG: putative heat shock protein [Verrucomicrobiales bacterium]|nr:putative heat shock protein [Verrucomicrobiales bacterium]
MNTMTEKRTQETQQQQREREQFVVPDVNIYETKDGYLLEAEMPGVNKEGLEITLEGTELTITGRRSDQPPQGADILFSESRLLNYRRVFELDPTVDTAKINAKVEQGVLTLTLPKAEKVKPKKITIA